ncbi:MAG: DUF433 domain-containing protein [Gemmataceae bacterium]
MDLPDFLTRTPHGEIDLTGQKIGLVHVVYRFNQGDSPELIVRHFPTLDLAHVYKVIAFYLENRSAVDEYIREHDAEMERHRAANTGPDWAAMRARVEAIRQDRSRPAGV